MRKSSAVAVLIVSVVSAVAACSSDKPKPVAPAPLPPDAGADAALVGVAGGLVLFPTTPLDAGSASTGPVFFTPDAGPSAPQPPAITEQAVDAAIDLAIATASSKVAPKMQREGQAGRATLKEGEHYDMVVTLQPNRCYTFLAFSPPGGVAQLDQKLLGIALAVEAGRSSSPDRSMPGLSVMGKGKDAICPLLPVPVPYKLDVVATKGAGRVGVQVYSRSK